MSQTRRTTLGLSLAGLATALARPARATAPTRAVPGAPARIAKHCVVLYMAGGASHIDTFDPKPGRDTGGPFAAIGTKLAGLQISEHLPGLADRADRLAVIRLVTATEGNHDRARYLMHTGYAPAGAAAHPALGSQVAAPHEDRALPGYVAIGGSGLGDFGRSPRINARGGRDHHPRASSVVLAGASISGRVVGATDSDGDRVTTDPVTVPDLMRTIAVGLGLDPDDSRMTPGRRPISVVDGGRMIQGLWG